MHRYIDMYLYYSVYIYIYLYIICDIPKLQDAYPVMVAFYTFWTGSELSSFFLEAPRNSCSAS